MARTKIDRCAVCGRGPHPKGIRHLPSKRYQARFLGPDGVRRQATFQTTKDAERWLHDQFAAISSGQWQPVEVEATVVTTFETYAARWLDRRRVKGRPLADRTREGYDDLLRRFILPAFGSRPIHTITREQAVRQKYRTLPLAFQFAGR